MADTKLLTDHIIKTRIHSGTHWDLVAYVRKDTTGIEFKLENTRGKGTSIPVSESEASVLLAMPEGRSE